MKHAKALFTCAAAAVALCSSAAIAQSYPTRIVRFVVIYPGGGSSDVMARIIGQKLTDAWGQQCLIDSKPGRSRSDRHGIRREAAGGRIHDASGEFRAGGCESAPCRK